MASSFAEQIPIIIHVIRELGPATVLDIGKGFGKYGLLIHEYCGVDHRRRPTPQKALKEQSAISIDAIDANRDYDFPHIASLYRSVIWNDVMAAYRTLERYDLVLLIDVVEHLPKSDVLLLLKHFLAQGSACLIATPRHFFQQELFESHWERHCSHWTAKDFRGIGHLESQSTRSSRIFLLSPTRKAIVGFGNRFRQRLKRIVWALLTER